MCQDFPSCFRSHSHGLGSLQSGKVLEGSQRVSKLGVGQGPRQGSSLLLCIVGARNASHVCFQLIVILRSIICLSFALTDNLYMGGEIPLSIFNALGNPFWLSIIGSRLFFNLKEIGDRRFSMRASPLTETNGDVFFEKQPVSFVNRFVRRAFSLRCRF